MSVVVFITHPEVVIDPSVPVPQWPLSVALVERHDSLYRYDRYLNHTAGDAEIWRLRLSLGFTRSHG